METETIADTGRSLLRAIHVRTVFGDVDGWLQTNPILRTLDDLNAVARDFLVLREPRGNFESIHLRGGRLALNKASVLFANEIEATPPSRTSSLEAGLFSRAAVALWIGDYQISGFVHVPRGGAALSRLDQTGQPFLAVTSASVTGPGCELSLPFVAVNRARILAAEDLLPDEESVAALRFDELEPQP